MAKTENIFVKAKAYQKLHPRTAWADCIQKVKGKGKVSGTKKKNSRLTDAPVRKKRARKAAVRVGDSRPTIARVNSKIKRGEKLLKEIDKLEAKAKEVSNKDMKHLYYREINDLHKKLDQLKK